MPKISSYPIRALATTDFVLGVDPEGSVRQFTGFSFFRHTANIVDYGAIGNGFTSCDHVWGSIFADTTVTDIYVPDGTFRMGSFMTNHPVPNHVRRIFGPGTLAWDPAATANAQPVLFFSNFAGEIVVEGITIDATDDGLGILLQGDNSNIWVRNCRFKNASYAIIAFANTPKVLTNFRFTDNVVEDYQNGVIVTAGGSMSTVGCKILRNIIDGASPVDHCIGIHGGTGITNIDAEISGNIINAPTSGLFGITLGNTVSGGIIANNVVNTWFDCIHIDARGVGAVSADWLITGNSLRSTTDLGIATETTDNGISQRGMISNNFIKAVVGVYLTNDAAGTVRFISVIGNRIHDVGKSGFDGTGILLGQFSGSGGVVQDCIISHNQIHQTSQASFNMIRGVSEDNTGSRNLVFSNVVLGWDAEAIDLNSVGGTSEQSGNVTTI
jgi:hypothetical protein